MARFGDHSPAESQVILLSDDDTVRHRDAMAELAAQQACAITDAFSFSPGEAASNDDLTQVDAVVSALARAIADRMDIWLPFPGPDFGREQHWRRLSLVLQRHGLNVRFGRELAPCPATGGYSEVDFALRREVQAVDDLDNAALAAAGVESLRREIELALVAAGAPAPVMATVRRVPAGASTASRTENTWPPVLPAPTLPWAQRQPMLKRYVRWLVHDCGVTQVATARVLNSAGQRTPKGRRWRPATVSALLNGRYDHGAADGSA
ncbi:hypothetical protein [Mycobacterium xenopi]|uniref:Recombinase n=1 Tax=Mycobacterium xenopi TaxID=1789 RepID=A0AAD1H364_MYCXE|nr:hypothetical protein [Mycobacterium xenopi]MDA3639453.1 hypothetical protein [Mycobacterium xenopi]MDA3657689.1 hypothetical protein [Mycobacterium xenopi]MDA3663074.1 hypothetical protein [Mycobacterium xenopi]ORX20404.1 hypothetical protein AWC32_06275 [Mycobacterium xenopi]SPX90384.1 Uncharacterised protein [Mycobacterium xenopi]